MDQRSNNLTMQFLLLTIILLFLKGVVFGQALMSFQNPMLDNTQAFLGGNYDTSLLRKNKVESCQQNNITFYFDEGGRLSKSIFIRYDSVTQIQTYRYDSRGDLIQTEATGSNLANPITTTTHKTYLEGRLIKDSSSSGYFCKHLDYYKDGSLRQELWFGFDTRLHIAHRLQRAFWFGIDSLGRINRIIDRDYMVTQDAAGQLISNRILYYNEKNQMVREEEKVKREEKGEKTLFCPNAGSATYLYDEAGRITEINRSDGPSQKLKYLPNGLMAEIVTSGTNCEGRPYHWQWTYTYSYHK